MQNQLLGNTSLIVKRSGDKEIIDSGTIHNFNGNSITIILTNIEIEFKFFNTSTNMQNLSFDIPSTNKLVIKLENFNSSLPIGNLYDMDLGTYQGKKLYINFSVISLGELKKLLFYTIYLGEKVGGI